jgi:ribose 5-phosphate isomerase B
VQNKQIKIKYEETERVKFVIGADHRGYLYKEYIKKSIQKVEWIDVGAFDAARSDYPIFAHEAAQILQKGMVDGGILLCGSGIGMAIVANRYKGIRAALVWNVTVAQQSKEHDNANMLVLPSNYISEQEAVACITKWYKAQFLGGRYQERCDMIDNL